MNLKNKNEPCKIYLNSIKVATCDVCTGKKSKERVELNENPTFCPDCGYALFYELIQRAKKAS